MKVCKKCGLNKDLQHFSNYSASKDGKRPWCRVCMNKQNSSYMKTARGKEVHRATNQRYYKTEKGKTQRQKDNSKWSTRPCMLNGTKFLYNKEYKKKNRDKENLYYKKYRQLNPEKQAARVMVRQAVVLGIITRPNVCSVCHKSCKPQGHHEDYFKPLDVVWMCDSCHRKYHKGKGLWKRK